MATNKKSTKKGKITVSYQGASIPEVVHYVHGEIVRYCAYCGKPMSRSDVNDFGSLCENCYLKEYYG